ncbi:MAG TPA: transglycosylase SLT domain-containing protein [Gemmatimonadaceae bacterium]|nr:transglycosylase SLT domain-containing protein [Gemmatimonadaceae bacterium]
MDTVVATAERALEHGRPWTAAVMLRPVVADSTTWSADAALLLARAASAWGAWDEVEQQLRGAAWLDTIDDGEGHVLLMRAALAQDDLSSARSHAEAALAAASTPEHRRDRLIAVALVMERLSAHDAGLRDSAAALFTRAAASAPLIDDWLSLRAARLTNDASRRARVLERVRDLPARSQSALVEAEALEGAGDTSAAMAAYRRADREVDALRLALAITTPAGRDSIRDALRAIAEHGGASDARAAIDLLDVEHPTLSVAAERAIARRAMALGLLERASAGFQRVLARDGEAADRLAYATVLARRGMDRAAAREFRRVGGTRVLRATALLGRARAELGLGEREAARTALREVLRIAPHDDAAAVSLYLLADLATDEGRDAAARAAFSDVVERFPASTYAPRALFRAALISFVHRDWRRAAAEFDSLTRRFPNSDDAVAAMYWAGRSWASLGDTARAHGNWRRIVQEHIGSYYAGLSGVRLAVPALPEMDSASIPPAPDWMRDGLARIDALERVGLADEAALERARLRALADSSDRTTLALADALERRGRYGEGIRLARRSLARGARPSAALYRLIYPLPSSVAPIMKDAATSERVDPALVAALIHRESAFYAHARSGADARGLMQLLPSVGRMLARAAGVEPWDERLLDLPEVNIPLGVSHLAAALRQRHDLSRTLASYNAGDTRVDRWMRKDGTDDPEVFVERIPFAETRDYVRIVERARDLYAALYDW